MYANLWGVDGTQMLRERCSGDAPGNCASLRSLPLDMLLDSSMLSRLLLYPSAPLLDHLSFVPWVMGELFLPLWRTLAGQDAVKTLQ